MSNADLALKIDASPQYRDWLRRERQSRLTVRAVQVAILLVVLVLWEVLPRAGLINPLFTSYPSAIWPTFLELLRGSEFIHLHFFRIHLRTDRFGHDFQPFLLDFVPLLELLPFGGG